MKETNQQKHVEYSMYVLVLLIIYNNNSIIYHYRRYHHLETGVITDVAFSLLSSGRDVGILSKTVDDGKIYPCILVFPLHQSQMHGRLQLVMNNPNRASVFSR